MLPSTLRCRCLSNLHRGLSLALGASDAATEGYVPRFHQFVLRKGHWLVRTNLGKPGETGGTFVSGGQLNAALAAIDSTSDTRVVTLDIGGNDVLDLLNTGQPCATDPAGGTCTQAVAAALAAFTPKYQEILVAITIALTGDPGEEEILVMANYNPYDGTGSPFEVPVEGALLGSDRTMDCAANIADPGKQGLNDISPV